jgi:hypothetical protein
MGPQCPREMILGFLQCPRSVWSSGENCTPYLAGAMNLELASSIQAADAYSALAIVKL